MSRDMLHATTKRMRQAGALAKTGPHDWALTRPIDDIRELFGYRNEASALLDAWPLPILARHDLTKGAA